MRFKTTLVAFAPLALLPASCAFEAPAGEPGGPQGNASAEVVSKETGPQCSPCRALTASQCAADERCEGVPCSWSSIQGSYPADACDYGERGFDGANCFICGCRARGMYDVCDINAQCSYDVRCGTDYDGIDERGCLTCFECTDRRVADCALEALCAEQPELLQCDGSSDQPIWPFAERRG